MAVYSYNAKQLKRKVTPCSKINDAKDFLKRNLGVVSKTLQECSVIVKTTWKTSNRTERAGIVVGTWLAVSIVLSPVIGTIAAKQAEVNRQKYLASPEYAALVAEQKKQEQERIRQEQEVLVAQQTKTPEEEELERYNARQREKCFAQAVENKKALREEGWGNEFSELAGLAFAGCQ
jgi:hypothetical protein